MRLATDCKVEMPCFKTCLMQSNPSLAIKRRIAAFPSFAKEINHS
jgi:hypothetical protein